MIVALTKIIIGVIDVLELNLCKRVGIVFEALHAAKRLELLAWVVCEVGEEHWEQYRDHKLWDEVVKDGLDEWKCTPNKLPETADGKVSMTRLKSMIGIPVLGFFLFLAFHIDAKAPPIRKTYAMDMLSFASYPKPSIKQIFKIGPPPIPADFTLTNSYLWDTDEDSNDQVNHNLLKHFSWCELYY